MKAMSRLFAALVVGATLAGCATTGTKVSSNSEPYRELAKSQQLWCSSFKDACTCAIDGTRTTCSLVYACVNSCNCKGAQ